MSGRGLLKTCGGSSARFWRVAAIGGGDEVECKPRRGIRSPAILVLRLGIAGGSSGMLARTPSGTRFSLASVPEDLHVRVVGEHFLQTFVGVHAAAPDENSWHRFPGLLASEFPNWGSANHQGLEHPACHGGPAGSTSDPPVRMPDKFPFRQELRRQAQQSVKGSFRSAECTTMI